MSNLSERSTHYNENLGGVLWNPRIFRRFLPSQFFKILTNENLKKCYEDFDWKPLELHRVYIPNILYFLMQLRRCNEHTSLSDSPYMPELNSFMTGAKKLFFQLSEYKSGNRIIKCLSLGTASDAWRDYKANYKEDFDCIEEFVSHWLHLLKDHGYSTSLAIPLFRLCWDRYFKSIPHTNTLIYDATTDTYYTVSIRRANSYKHMHWEDIVAPEYVSLFQDIGDPTEFAGDPVTYWKRGLFYAYIDYATYYEEQQFSDIVPNLYKIRDITTVADVWNVGASLMPNAKAYMASFS